MSKTSRLTKGALLSIKPGATGIFAFENPAAIKSARAYISECTHVCRPDGVAKWKTTADWGNSILVVTAIPEEAVC